VFYRSVTPVVGGYWVFPGTLVLDVDDVLMVSIVGGDGTTDIRHQVAGAFLGGEVSECSGGLEANALALIVALGVFLGGFFLAREVLR
jgi:hypothetical protein